MSSRIVFGAAARAATMSALLVGGLLAAPPTVARAASAPTQLAQAAPAMTAAAKKTPAETVEQRITSLHKALKITPDQETAWSAVAGAMRENAANMQKLIDAKQSQSPESMTALDALMTYQTFAQAHVDGLKNLTTSFKTLYDGMPDAQKKTADQVFQKFGHQGAKAHG